MDDDYGESVNGICDFDLPFEITASVMSFLHPSDIFNASLVCSAWNEACQETSVWRALYATTYGSLTPQASVVVEGCLKDINFLTLFRDRMRFDIEEMKLSPEGYFSEAIKFRSMEVPKIEQKILTRRMSKQKLRSIGSPERLVELSVYVIHIVEQLGIHVEGKKLKSRDGSTNHERHSAILLHLTDMLSRVVTELHKLKRYDWARVINDADFALSAVGMPLNDTSFMNNHAASWIQKAQVAMNSEDEQERKDIPIMFKHADEILLAMPEWDLLKYYNLACSWALQSDFEKAKFALKMTFAIATEEEWKEMREMCRPYQERLNPDGLPSPNHVFPPTFSSTHIRDLKLHAISDPDLIILAQFDWYREFTHIEGVTNDEAGEQDQEGADGDDASSDYDLDEYNTTDSEAEDPEENELDEDDPAAPLASDGSEDDENGDEEVEDDEEQNEGHELQ